MDVAIVGGTGTVGAEAVRELSARGHDVRVLSRHAPECPWTIVRATQFHTLVARTFAASSRVGVLPSVRVPLQPVDPREVGRVLADTAEAEPSLAITQFAGPEVLSVCELARRWRERTGSHALPVRLPVARSLRSGALTNPGAWRGKVTFDAWLAS
jgi:uncharacterized protein YbjT (DUF2867 family)